MLCCSKYLCDVSTSRFLKRSCSGLRYIRGFDERFRDKVVKQFIVWLFLIALLGCEVISSINKREFVDVRLIGIWAGEYREKNGTLKKWIQTRNADGSYIIDFSYHETNGEMKSFTESGKWWVKNRFFHEMTQTDMRRPDKYRYHVADKCVYFELVEDSELVTQFEEYSFNECLTNDSPQASIKGEQRSGNSLI